MKTKLCPNCQIKMKLRGTQSYNDKGDLQWFYFVYCGVCGGGPSVGAADPEDILNHWSSHG